MVPHVNPFKRSRNYIPLQTFNDRDDATDGSDADAIDDSGGGGDGGGSGDGGGENGETDDGRAVLIRDRGIGDVRYTVDKETSRDRAQTTKFVSNGVVENGVGSNGGVVRDDGNGDVSDNDSANVDIEGNGFDVVGESLRCLHSRIDEPSA